MRRTKFNPTVNMAFSAGTRLDHYDVTALLGEGDGSASACGPAQRTQAAGRQERRGVSCVDLV